MDQWAYVNKFSKIHPFEKFLVAIVTMFLVLLWDKPVFQVSILIIMGIGTVLGAGIPFKVYIKYMTIPLLFIFITLLSVLLEVHTVNKDFLFTIEIFHVFIGISKESIGVAIALFFRSTATLTCLYFLAMTTSMQELIYLLEKFHCPSIVTELMVLTYRFIFVFLKTARTIYYAQSTRLGYNGFVRSLKSLSILSSVLFIKAYMQAKALNQATLSRGYQGTFYQLNTERTLNKRRLIIIIAVEIGLFIIGGISPK
ncbi:MAG: cobalt ECF transporter T component CbiQ [Firmicutes bacterium HGW-Firmicutes-1]|jgi:cobalt/nickel transport system permease protein|nr:MAG: cobalt ECF transporter T component CbiQ [Firmicutes bacterium HGW-Firmicutes-1]